MEKNIIIRNEKKRRLVSCRNTHKTGLLQYLCAGMRGTLFSPYHEGT